MIMSTYWWSTDVWLKKVPLVVTNLPLLRSSFTLNDRQTRYCPTRVVDFGITLQIFSWLNACLMYWA